jgi:hypothetical protein
MRAIFLITLLLGGELARAASDRDAALRYWREKENQTPARLVEILRQVPESSPRFGWAIGEAAKQQYRAGNWPAFFGLLHYAHSKPKVFTSELNLLEAVARARHCRWSEALALLQHGDEDKSPGSRALRSFLALRAKLVELPKPVVTPSLSTTRWYWSLVPSHPDPFSLRETVPSACPEGR